MEFARNPDFISAATDVGIFLLAHLAIYTNRQKIRPTLNSATYDKISLYSEHFLSYLTTCLLGRATDTVLAQYNHVRLDINDLLIPMIRSLGSNFIVAKQDWGKSQWDQFAFDMLGISTYFLFIRN